MNTSSKLNIICFLILSLTFENVSAQQYRMSILSVNNGLSQHGSEKVIQDHLGYIWISSYDGLNRFNGVTNEIFRYDPSDECSLSGNRITELYIDKQQQLWVGLDGDGFCRYDYNNRTFERYRFAGITKCNIIYSMLFIDNQLFLGTADGLVITKKEDITSKSIANYSQILKGIRINDINIINEKRIIIASSQGVYICELTNGNALSHKISNSMFTRKLYRYEKDTWWIVARDGLYRYIDSSGLFERIPIIDDPQKGYKAVIKDNEGKLWCLIEGEGLCNLVEDDKEAYRLSKVQIKNNNYFFNNLVTSLYIDYSNNLWIGSSYKGIAYMDLYANNFFSVHMTDTKSTSTNVVRAITATRDKLWIGTINNGLFHFKLSPDGKITEQTKVLLDEQSVKDFYKDAQDNLWVCASKLMFLKNSDSKDQFIDISQKYNEPKLRRYGDPLSIVEDEYGNLWIAYKRGLVKMNMQAPNNQFTYYDYSKEEQVSLMWDNTTSKLWLCSRHNGLRSYQIDHAGNITDIQYYRFDQNNENSLSSNHVWSIKRSLDKKKLWIATDSGLDMLETTTGFITRLSSEKINSCKVAGFCEDPYGTIWLNTTHGLWAYHSKDNMLKQYDFNNGLASSTLTEASFLYNDSVLFIGTINGFSYFNIKKMTTNPYPVKLHLTNVRIKYESNATDRIISITNKNEITLSHKENNISFEFNALQFNNPQKIKYRYFLKGYDNSWNEIDASKPTAVYRKLNAGKYTFYLTACNNDGVWCKDNIIVPIIIEPSPFLTWYAFGIYSLISALLIFLLIKHTQHIAKRKQNELLKELQIKNEKELNEARISLYTDITHELRTPLTMILAPIENMRKLELDQKISNNINIMAANADRLLNLVNQYLDIHKVKTNIRPLQIAEGDLIKTIHHIKTGFDAIAEKHHIKYSMICDETKHIGWYDEEKISKIINNLLSNAFKFTHNDGQVSIFIDFGDGIVNIAVEDSGIGIIKEEIPLIFNRFYKNRNESAKVGTGIGLDLVKRLVEIHKGTITVLSTPHKGSTFSVSIPINKEVFEPQSISDVKTECESAEVVADITDSDKPIIMIVDDDQWIRNYLVDSFCDIFQVMTASNGAEALQLIINHIPDIVISDVMMPEMSGIELCNLIKNDFRTSHIPVILLTAKDMENDIFQGLSSGAEDYIVKPFSFDLLKLKVQNIINSRKSLQKQPEMQKYANTNNKEHIFINKIKEIFYQQIDNSEFGIENLCKELCISRMQLHRKLTALVGKSTSEYLRELRLQKAKELLETGEYTVLEVIYQVGFNNHSYFSKTFKELFGYPPSSIISKSTET